MSYLNQIICCFKKEILFFIFFFLGIIFHSNAQSDTIYFDSNWDHCAKEIAIYYRIPSEKKPTKIAIGYTIKDIDSVYVIEDYYVSTKNIQFKGYSKEKEGRIFVGQAQWFDENGNLISSRNYEPLPKKDVSKHLDWQPLFYANYTITVKSQFTAGLEFCLACDAPDKLFLGLGYGISSYDGNYFGLPNAYLSMNTAQFFFIKVGGSNRNLYSLAGFTFLNFMDLGFGYSYPIVQEKSPELKGFTFGLTVRLTKNSKVYTPLKIGF